jgi:hypothetical protein
MAKDILKYEAYFTAGMRIRMEIPLPGEKTFEGQIRTFLERQ